MAPEGSRARGGEGPSRGWPLRWDRRDHGACESIGFGPSRFAEGCIPARSGPHTRASPSVFVVYFLHRSLVSGREPLNDARKGVPEGEGSTTTSRRPQIGRQTPFWRCSFGTTIPSPNPPKVDSRAGVRTMRQGRPRLQTTSARSRRDFAEVTNSSANRLPSFSLSGR